MKRITFGSDEAVFHPKFINADPFVIVDLDGIDIKSRLIGAYNFSNIAMAVAVGQYFDIQTKAIKTAIENYIPTNNRSQIIEKKTNKIILDAYNANPNSMDAALHNLSGLSDETKIAILGDMFEVGKDVITEHQKIADLITTARINKAFLIGESFYKTNINHPNIYKFKTFEAFKTYLKEETFQNTTILIKASRGMALERVLELI